MEKRNVGFADPAIAKLIGERAMDFVVSRNEERAGGFAVEAMHDSRAQFPADGGKFAARAERVQQSVDHCAGLHSRAGVDDHSRGLINHYEVFIGVQNFERDGFRLRVHGRWRGNFNCDGITGFDAMGTLGRSTIDAGVAMIK